MQGTRVYKDFESTLRFRFLPISRACGQKSKVGYYKKRPVKSTKLTLFCNSRSIDENVKKKEPDYYGTKTFGIGLSPFVPKFMIIRPAVVRLTYQVEPVGRKTAVSKRPSPS
jgi:hypothetical protein